MYPERLHRAYIVDAPWAFRAVWKVVSLLLDPVTKDKMCFIENRESDAFRAAIARDIAADQLERFLGGSLARAYDHAVDERPGEALADVRRRLRDEARAVAPPEPESGGNETAGGGDRVGSVPDAVAWEARESSAGAAE